MISQPCMDVQEGCLPFRGVICWTGGIYAAQGGYMLFRRVIWMFRGVICCSGGLYDVQVGYMDFEEGYMMKKIMMILVATNVVASRPPKCRPTGTSTACARLRRRQYQK